MAKEDNTVMPSGEEPQYERGGQDRPVVSTAASAKLRSLLLGDGASAAELAKAAVNLQLAAWEKTKTEAELRRDAGMGKLTDLDFGRLKFAGVLGENPKKDVDVILAAMTKGARGLGKDFWTWERMPYVIRCAGLAVAKDVAERPKKKTRVDAGEQLLANVDEWVLRNEMYLRSISRKPSSATPQSKSWTFGLIQIQDIPVVVPGHTPVCDDAGATLAVKIPRDPLSSLPGYTILNAKRVDAVYLQPTPDAFRARWGAMTDGLLTGLNWDNVFVAGGVVLGALLTPEIPSKHADAPHVNKMDEWKSSDIDMYIYGLGPDLANEKIEHIAATYKKNIPDGAPFLVVRNSQTVTLYSEWPRRRVQIVLKLIGSPREVLLNFDLDICAAGFDGSNVFLLPRCVRALETGTNVFTMDLINGHYLGDRKATRDKRVFKYANKGYGIRILPTYIAALSTYSDRKKLSAVARGERLYADITLPKIASDSRSWTQKIVSEYKKVGTHNRPFHWPHNAYPPVKSDKPVFSHAMLESYAQVTSEPLGRSCLTGFSLLMRHVALWEQEVNGNIMIFEDLWATDTYGEGPLQQVAYDDSPPYAWDESFSIKGFARAIDEFNEKEVSNVHENFGWISEAPLDDKTISAARTTYGSTVSEVLSPGKDILIPILIPEDFFKFANEMTVKALRQALNLDQSIDLEPLRPAKIVGKDDVGEESEKVVIWRLDKVLNWQMLDRRIDEVREALWAFHRTNERMVVGEDQRMKLLKTNISRRAIRTTVEDETEAFVRWVARKPYHESTKLPAMYVLNEDYGMNGPEDDDGGDYYDNDDGDDD